MPSKRTFDGRHDLIPYLEPSKEIRALADLLPRATVGDRIQATIRHPAYWKNLKEYLSKSKKGKSLKGISIPLFWEPQSPVADRWNLPATIIDKRHAERLIEYYKSRPWRSSEPIRVLSVKPRYILVEIDLSETVDRLQHVLGTLLGWYQKDLGWALPHRNRPFRCDPFHIYDLCKQTNISKAAQTAHGIAFPRGEGPAYSPKAKQLYAQVSRANQWAKQMIAQVGKEAGH